LIVFIEETMVGMDVGPLSEKKQQNRKRWSPVSVNTLLTETATMTWRFCGMKKVF